MADLKEPKTETKFFDIAKPSTTPANPTSKSVIVGHGPIMRDPTLVEKTAESESAETVPSQEVAITTKHSVIKPLNEDIKPEAEVKPAEEQPEETKSEPPSTEAKAEPQEKPVANEKVENQSKDQEEAKQLALKRQAEIEQLIDTGKFFLPVNMVEKRRTQRIVLGGALLCILLAIVWYDVALDAGMISNTLHLPHTHFFALKS